jgi:hypothetical protein
MTNEEFEKRLLALESGHRNMSADLVVLKDSLEKNTTALQDFIELGKGLKFGLKILGAVERVAVWVTKCAAALGVMWAVWKFLILEALQKSRS